MLVVCNSTIQSPSLSSLSLKKNQHDSSMLSSSPLIIAKTTTASSSPSTSSTSSSTLSHLTPDMARLMLLTASCMYGSNYGIITTNIITSIIIIITIINSIN
jgi:hypothetical protein